MTDGKPTPTHFTFKDLADIPPRSAIKNLKRPDDPEFADFVVKGDDAPKHIFWQGRQWAVTEYGVETYRNAPYHYVLKYEQLVQDEHVFDHIAEKGWADPVDFLHAAAIALQRHAKALQNPAPATPS